MENQNFMLPRGRESSVPSSLARLAHFGHDKRFREDGGTSSADGAKIVAPTHPPHRRQSEWQKEERADAVKKSWGNSSMEVHLSNSTSLTLCASDPIPASCVFRDSLGSYVAAVPALLYVI